MPGLDLTLHTILVAEDEVFSREILVRMLASMGSPTIHQAANGEEAMNFLWKQRELSFVISDLNMPVVNGLQLLKAVRTGRCGVDRATPFAMLTGYSDRNLVETALNLDVNSFVIKPISKESLEKRLGHLLGFANDASWVKPVAVYRRVDTRGAGWGAPDVAAPDQEVEPEHNDVDSEAKDGSQAVGWTRARGGRAPASARPRTAAGGKFTESDLAGQGASVFRRLSALRGKFQDSDLAGDIAAGVSQLVADIGDQGAAEIVGALDALQRRGDLSLDDIAAVLAPSSDPAARRHANGPHRRATGPEEFRVLGDVPVGASLARDIKTRDGHVFIRADITMTQLILTLLAHLDSLKVLDLPIGAGQSGGSGIYVRVPDGATSYAAAQSTVIREGGRQVDIGDIPEGAIAARGIYTVDGNLYLPAGSPITPRIVSLLEDLRELGKLTERIWITV